MNAPRLMHATAVAMGGDALLLRGPSGAGKSDLALRLLGLGLPSHSNLDVRRDAAPSPPFPPPQGGRGPETARPLFGAGGDAFALRLVADDQVRLVRQGEAILASPPETLRGLLEVRGLGIVRVAYVDTARVRLIVDLVPLAEVPRMPPEDDTVDVLGVAVPRLRLNAFEASAPLKCALALHARC